MAAPNMPHNPAVFALSEAIRLAEHGYHLTPVTLARKPNGKKDARFHRTSWKNEADVSNDPDQIRAWFTDHPDTSFALVCGASGVEGVDLDVKPAEGIDAVTWWAERGLPMGSLLVETPSGGLHLIWRRRTGGRGLPNRAGEVAPGVDTRSAGNASSAGGLFFAAGGYVVGEGGHYTVQGPLLRADQLAETPAEVLELFPAEKARGDRPANGEITEHRVDWMHQKAREQLDRVRQHKRGAGGFRHILMGAAMVLGRLVEAGLADRAVAVRALREACVAVWGCIDDEDEQWIQDGLRDGPTRERWRVRSADPLGVAGLVHAAEHEPAAETPAPATGEATNYLLPREVWDSTPILNHIYRAAMATLTCPDAVLHATLATVASLLHHETRVDTGVRPSVLSYYTAVIGASGAGKSEALSVARDLLKTWSGTDTRFAITGAGGYFDGPLGSGEGLIEAFMGEELAPVLDPTGNPVENKDGSEKMRTVRKQVRHNALFHTDEGRQVLAIDSRKGATILAVLCELWSGAVAGQTNADRDRSRKLEAGSYVLGMLLGFQPATIDGLFADTAGGAPQRFTFAPAAYPPHLDEDGPEFMWPGDLNPPIPAAAVTVHLGPEQKREVRRARRRKAAGVVDENENPLDGHRTLMRCRVAALLALLHGEAEVSDATWELSGLITDRSCALRDFLSTSAERAAREAMKAKDDRMVAVKVQASAIDEHRQRVRRALDSLVEKLDARGGTETRGRARNGVAKSLRPVVDEAIGLGIAEGLIVEEDRGGTLRLIHDRD